MNLTITAAKKMLTRHSSRTQLCFSYEHTTGKADKNVWWLQRHTVHSLIYCSGDANNSSAYCVSSTTTTPCAWRPADWRDGLLSPPAPGRTPEQHPASGHPKKNLPTQWPTLPETDLPHLGISCSKKFVKVDWMSLIAQIFMKQHKPVCIYSWRKHRLQMPDLL